MKARWLILTLLLHSGMPALAQLDHDPENDEPVHNTPPRLPRHIVPASQVNAETAAVSPAGSDKSRPAAKSGCSNKTPCAEATPAR